MSLSPFGASAERGHGHGTAVEALDPRVKLVCAGALALWVGLLPAGREFLLVFLGVGLVALGALAEIAPATLIIRASAALPFVLVPGLLRALGGELDLRALGAMAGRGYAAAMVVTLLISVTPFPDLLRAASVMGAPDLLVQTTALTYRYLLVLRARAAALVQSALARGYGRRTPRRVEVAGNMLGALLLRSLDRAERVHRAMLARGYTGRFPARYPRRMRPVDWLAGGGVLAGVGLSLAALW